MHRTTANPRQDASSCERWEEGLSDERPGKVLWRRWDASWAPEEDRTLTDGSGVNGGLFMGRGKAGSRAKSRVRRREAHSVDNGAALEWEPGLCGGEGWWIHLER